jgi:hypothetical protein
MKLYIRNRVIAKLITTNNINYSDGYYSLKTIINYKWNDVLITFTR